MLLLWYWLCEGFFFPIPWFRYCFTTVIQFLTPHSEDLNRNSPCCLPYISCNVCSKNLVLNQMIICLLIFSSILITCLLSTVWILWGEIMSWLLMVVEGLMGVLIIFFSLIKLFLTELVDMIFAGTPRKRRRAVSEEDAKIPLAKG